MSYLDLREKSRYIKDLTAAGTGKTLRPDEIELCEEFADSLIEGFLGKTWEAGSVPRLIEHIADLLGSSKAYKFVITGQLPNDGDYPKSLRDEAMELLRQIKDGEIGLILPDGTWDEDYPGSQEESEYEIVF